MLRRDGISCAILTSLLAAAACRDRRPTIRDSASALPPVYPAAPTANTGWDSGAGPLMITPFENSADTVAVIIPEVTDSTVAIVETLRAPVAGLAFDLFGRGGRVANTVRSIALSPTDTAKLDCYGWPLARLTAKHAGWAVGFSSGRTKAIPLDSIEVLPASDSAALAASIVRAAATLPGVSDPTFRGLPFRVRSAFRFRIDSVDAVIADVVRAVNEEANPRIEHLLVVVERAAGTLTPFTVRYSNRTAGSEESTQASELLAAVAIGDSSHPALVISIDYSDGNRLALLEKIGGQWRVTWRSAYTDC